MRRWQDWRERLEAERDAPPEREPGPVAPAVMARQIPLLFRPGQCLRLGACRIVLLNFQNGRWGCLVLSLMGARRARFQEATLAAMRRVEREARDPGRD